MKLLLCILCLMIASVSDSQTVKRFDVLIHELFADPSPSAGLPASEFIELRNNSAGPINLRNWKISDGSSTATISINYILQADSCVVVCPAAALPAFSAIGPALSVSSFPSLNNEADVIRLISPEGVVIHFVAYETSWYRNAVKSEGGWTLEMIDHHNPCSGFENWSASESVTGGTPGRKNSIARLNPDLQPPALLRTYALDSVTIAVLFDEPLDSLSASQTMHYSFNKGLSVVEAQAPGPPFTQVNLRIASRLAHDTVHTLTVSGLHDCAGNSIGMMNTAKAGLSSEAQRGDVVINEILFDPRSDGTDHIELYNRSSKVIDAISLYIRGSQLRRLSETPFLLFPGEYLVIAADLQPVRRQYVVRHPENMLVVQIPSMPDDEGDVILMNDKGAVIDELHYDAKWHFPLIVNKEGIALERIDPDAPTQEASNWTSAASDAGYGTPTYRNSQYKSFQLLNAKIELTPALFSPDNDGMDDMCFIHYQLTSPNNVASVTVFDIKGNAVKNVCNNVTLSEKGFFRWDGTDNKGNPLPTGVYVVRTSLFNIQGSVKNFKNTVTLARRF